MTELFEINKLIDKGFSLITADKNKRPLGSWKNAQTTASNKEVFKGQFLSKGAEGVCGIVTGYNDLEVMDVDLKVFSTAKEKKEWFAEYMSFLQDNIMDFDEKVVIYKTKNEGFHILYKTKRVEGNLKIAKLKGHSQQVLETRGVGGYVVLYNNSYNKRSYLDIDYISDEDREILMSCSRSYNHIEQVAPAPKKETSKVKVSQEGLSPWDDFNQRESGLDLLTSNGFKIVRRLSDKTLFKRDGADSSHSGSVFHDTGMMYMHSTGTQFENELGYMPFHIYAILNHNGDKGAATKALYEAGYGDRYVKEMPVIEVYETEEVHNTEFPLEVFPEELQVYIKACNESLNNSIDYMACSLMFLSSIIIGNSMELEIKRGWRESANLWMSLVGRAGVGKTPSISSITFPLSRLNNIEIKKHIEDAQKYESYMNMNEKEKAMSSVVEKPRKTQFIVNDVTLEALVELHNENPNGIGVLKDELAGFFKDMNKYREGGDLEHWLSSWSGKEINLNRKTAKSSFVEKAFLPIMGGIQPSILDAFHTDENKDNGFLDRMLFTFPDIEIERYSDKEMSQKVLDWYESYITTFYQSTKRNIKYSEGGTIEPIIAKFTPEADVEWRRIFNEITDIQNGEDESESMKSMLPKQKAYICRFALIINTLASLSDRSISKDIIEVESVLKAEKLSKYFVSMNKKLIVESIKRNKSRVMIDKKKTSEENFRAVFKKNPKITNKDMATLIGVSVRTIANYKKNLK